PCSDETGVSPSVLAAFTSSPSSPTRHLAATTGTHTEFTVAARGEMVHGGAERSSEIPSRLHLTAVRFLVAAVTGWLHHEQEAVVMIRHPYTSTQHAYHVDNGSQRVDTALRFSFRTGGRHATPSG